VALFTEYYSHRTTSNELTARHSTHPERYCGTSRRSVSQLAHLSVGCCNRHLFMSVRASRDAVVNSLNQRRGADQPPHLRPSSLPSLRYVSWNVTGPNHTGRSLRYVLLSATHEHAAAAAQIYLLMKAYSSKHYHAATRRANHVQLHHAIRYDTILFTCAQKLTVWPA